ncbi:MAG: hypothetical protein FJ291_20410 [Planctomycetes bacterium]|nr:hypothetical protein [Planctomycetota bacterium]
MRRSLARVLVPLLLLSISLHAATIGATNLRLKVAMGKTPACKLPPRAFRLTKAGFAADPGANQGGEH